MGKPHATHKMVSRSWLHAQLTRLLAPQCARPKNSLQSKDDSEAKPRMLDAPQPGPPDAVLQSRRLSPCQQNFRITLVTLLEDPFYALQMLTPLLQLSHVSLIIFSHSSLIITNFLLQVRSFSFQSLQILSPLSIRKFFQISNGSMLCVKDLTFWKIMELRC